MLLERQGERESEEAADSEPNPTHAAGRNQDRKQTPFFPPVSCLMPMCSLALFFFLSPYTNQGVKGEGEDNLVIVTFVGMGSESLFLFLPHVVALGCAIGHVRLYLRRTLHVWTVNGWRRILGPGYFDNTDRSGGGGAGHWFI